MFSATGVEHNCIKSGDRPRVDSSGSTGREAGVSTRRAVNREIISIFEELQEISRSVMWLVSESRRTRNRAQIERLGEDGAATSRILYCLESRVEDVS